MLVKRINHPELRIEFFESLPMRLANFKQRAILIKRELFLFMSVYSNSTNRASISSRAVCSGVAGRSGGSFGHMVSCFGRDLQIKRRVG